MPIPSPTGSTFHAKSHLAAARRAAALGMEGKWAIHPSQVGLANQVFSPPENEVIRARKIIEALKTAEEQGKGAAALDGKMIDAASERMARNVLVMHEAIGHATRPGFTAAG